MVFTDIVPGLLKGKRYTAPFLMASILLEEHVALRCENFRELSMVDYVTGETEPYVLTDEDLIRSDWKEDF